MTSDTSKHTAVTEKISTSSLSQVGCPDTCGGVSGKEESLLGIEQGEDILSETVAPNRRISHSAKIDVVEGDPEKKLHKQLSRSSLEVQREITATVRQSKLLNSRRQRLYWSQLPRFHLDELVSGCVLGRGQFGVVKEITCVRLQENAYDQYDRYIEGYVHENSCSDEGNVTGEVSFCNTVALEGRDFISKHCIRRDFEGRNEGTGDKPENHTRYAIKMMKSSQMEDADSFFCAALDLANEAHYLSAMEHPNIVKLRGLAMENPGQSEQFFLVLDRLYDTLAKRIVLWRKRFRKEGKMLRKVFRSGRVCKNKKVLLDDRLTVAADLADAIRYMHSKNILHRDLKPDNIGFDVRDDVKIFDFGLAKEVQPMGDLSDGETYELSGETGSMRYMAPEVYRHERYNASVDIYSFGLIMWEIMALEKPFRAFDVDMLVKLVFDAESRPKLDDTWPKNVRETISDCWSANYRDRPRPASVVLVLKGEILRLRGEKDSPSAVKRREQNEKGLDHGSRRSTYVSSLKRASSSSLALASLCALGRDVMGSARNLKEGVTRGAK